MSQPLPPPIVEIERRLRWSALAVISFIVILAFLAVLGVLAAITPVHPVCGLPDDPGVAAARELLAGRVSVPTEDLRFESALFGGPETPDSAPAPGMMAARHALDVADSLLRAAQSRHPADSRIPAMRGHLELARRRYASAERLYRLALDRAAHTSEARLGLGLALARRASAESDPVRARALELMSIAQFAAVHPDAPEYPAALYDRALMLARAGRRDEARRFAQEYLARDSVSAWAARLRAEAPY